MEKEFQQILLWFLPSEYKINNEVNTALDFGNLLVTIQSY